MRWPDPSPARRSGSAATRCANSPEPAARDLRITLVDGTPAPPGSVLVVDGADQQTVGYDGLVHVEPQAPGAAWELRGAFGRCRLVPVDATSLQCEDIR